MSTDDVLFEVAKLAQSTRNRFWSELRSAVDREWPCPAGYDPTQWAMERSADEEAWGFMEAAYRRVVEF
jgi:hypothetical protein